MPANLHTRKWSYQSLHKMQMRTEKRQWLQLRQPGNPLWHAENWPNRLTIHEKNRQISLLDQTDVWNLSEAAAHNLILINLNKVQNFYFLRFLDWSGYGLWGSHCNSKKITSLIRYTIQLCNKKIQLRQRNLCLNSILLRQRNLCLNSIIQHETYVWIQLYNMKEVIWSLNSILLKRTYVWESSWKGSL